MTADTRATDRTAIIRITDYAASIRTTDHADHADTFIIDPHHS